MSFTKRVCNYLIKPGNSHSPETNDLSCLFPGQLFGMIRRAYGLGLQYEENA